MAWPWRVIATVWPYSTARKSSAKRALASVVETSRMAPVILTGQVTTGSPVAAALTSWL